MAYSINVPGLHNLRPRSGPRSRRIGFGRQIGGATGMLLAVALSVRRGARRFDRDQGTAAATQRLHVGAAIGQTQCADARATTVASLHEPQ